MIKLIDRLCHWWLSRKSGVVQIPQEPYFETRDVYDPAKDEEKILTGEAGESYFG